MLKDFFWKIFEHTGNLDSYIFYREMAERNKTQGQAEAEAEAATGRG